MDRFLRLGAYVLHPLLMPLLGVLLYYYITPRFIEPELIRAKIAAITILTVLIPLILFFLLKSLNIVSSIHLPNAAERKVPLMIQGVLLVLIIKVVYNPYDSAELYFFFVGILFSAITAFLLTLLDFKVSLHQMGIAGATMFLLGLSVHFKVNMLLWIAIFLFGNGWVASSRLHTKSHDQRELIFGFFVGLIPQVIVFNLWL